MKRKVPYTPLSTPLSSSARETELRLRNIFSGPKKRPPALFLALMFSMCIFCGNLVSCQEAETKNPPPAEAWVDYWIIPLNVDWEESAELEPPEYPGVTFRWTSGSVSAVKDGETAELFRGMPIWNVFLCDLNGDGLRELCATVSYGSGPVDSHVVVYDYAAGAEYTLWDRGIEDYALSLEEGRLQVTRAKYLGPAVSTGGLALTENGTLEMTDEVPFPDGAALYHPYDPYGSEPDGNGQKVPETMENIPGVTLSEEELAQFSEIFYTVQANVNYFLPVNGFFNSYYDDVTELDFVEFLRYYPDDGCLEEEDAAEFEALSGLPDFPWKAEHFEKETITVNDLPTPTHRILRSSVDETLQKYAGITTSDLKNIEGVLYLPEYDAYYNFTSDFGPGLFRCVGGKRDGNTIRLWSDIYSYDSSRGILTLQEADGTFYIKSLQKETL